MGRIASIFSAGSAPPLVVWQRAPALRVALYFMGVVIFVLAFYIVYELGRYNAGFDRQAAAQQRTELAVQIEHLERSNREMRTKLAEADTIRAGRAREQAQVARDLGDLQAQVGRQSQELAFYRGVVAQAATALGVKIEQLRVSAAARPNEYTVHMALVRSGRADTEASGTVQMSLDGTVAGVARTLDLAALTAGKQRELRFGFRYLQDFDQDLTLPVGFKPEHLAVEVHSSRKDAAPLSQTFLWTVETPP
ncbi:MAG TPA: DUF6776 family protein [Steroidobacteraceae bacterium]|nr:DUF6776 family protein [Steroidobacteraceae bacterium]